MTQTDIKSFWDSIPRGTNVLVESEHATVSRRFMLRAVGTNLDADEAPIILSTTKGTEYIIRNLEENGSDDVLQRTGVIDCIDTGSETQADAKFTATVSSPTDLTGLGMKFTEIYAELEALSYSAPRLAFDSLTTLLVYNDVDSVNRFLHVLTGRVASVGGRGLYHVNPSAHEDKTVNALRHPFDARITIRSTDEDNYEYRARGDISLSTDWAPLPL